MHAAPPFSSGAAVVFACRVPPFYKGAAHDDDEIKNTVIRDQLKPRGVRSWLERHEPRAARKISLTRKGSPDRSEAAAS